MAARKQKTPTWLIPVAALAGIAVVGYMVYRVMAPVLVTEDSCQLLAQQQTAALDLQATVNNLDLVKAKVGVTAAQVQEVDAILRDYAFRYAGSCRDHEAGRISTGEYACKRDNMDRALATARSLAITLAEVKNIPDAGAQRDVVLKDLTIIQQLAASDFAAGCGSALAVTPVTITFEDTFPERTFEVTNSGNRAAAYSVTDLPEAFVAVRSSGTVAAGSGAVVSIKRTPFAPPPSPVVFHVTDNAGSRVPMTITFDARNAALYQELGAAVKSALPAGTAATLGDALAVVSERLPQITDEGTRYFFAAGILQEAGSPAEAGKAVTEVSRRNEALFQAPVTQKLSGAINVKLKQIARPGPIVR